MLLAVPSAALLRMSFFPAAGSMASFVAMLMVFSIALLFAGPSVQAHGLEAENGNRQAGQGSPDTQAIIVLDDAGNTIVLSRPARRIISLYAALTESLVALGQEESIIGRTVSDTKLPQLPVVGTHMRPNLELVAGLQPDLIVLMEGREAVDSTAERLQSMGFAVVRFRVQSFEDLFACILRLGILTGSREKAETLVAQYETRLQAVRSLARQCAARPSIFFEVRYPNLLGAGGHSILADIIHTAGGENSLGGYEDKFVRLNEEMLFSLNPDMYLVQEGAMNRNPLHPKERRHFLSLGAVRSGSVLLVPEDLFSRPGPSSIAATELLGLYIRVWDAHRNAGTAPGRPGP